MTRLAGLIRWRVGLDRRRAALWSSMFVSMIGLFASPSPGQTGWTRLSNQPPTTTPAWNIGTRLTYDTVRHETLVVVPFDLSGPGPAAVWAFDGNIWSQRPSQNAPQWERHVSTFDSIRARLVLAIQSGSPIQTWEWDGANWSRRTSPRAPPFVSLLTFDSARGRAVAWAGDSTWEWDGINWSRFAALGPTTAGNMAFDAARGGVILLTEDSQTWLWNGAIWSRQNTAHAPPPHSQSTMAYDSVRQRLVLFGGSTGTSILRATWELDGSDWIERMPANAPQARFYPAAAYDVSRQRVVLFGGQEAVTRFSDTWEWDGNDWSYHGPETVPPPRTGHALMPDEHRQVSVLFGGNSGRGFGLAEDLWEFDGVRWRFRSPATGPRGRVSYAMTYDAVRGVTLVFGGFWDGGVLGDFWSWDGARWTELPSSTGPTPRAAQAMVFDRARGRTVLFGGQDTYGVRLGDTWDWDGAQWRLLSTAVTPPPRSWHALCFDATRSQTLLFGGDTAQGLAGDTWTFDGTTWRSHAPATAPSPRRLHAMVWDAARQRVVLSGGLGAAGVVLSDTWEWDGRTWLPQAATQSHGPRYAHALAYDGLTGRVLAFAGNDGAQRLQDLWSYQPTVRGAATPFGTGCAGSAGVPTLSAIGAPIVGNRDFGLELGPTAPLASILIGLSCNTIQQPLPGGCELYLPPVTLESTQSNAAGYGRIGTAIPLDASLSGVSIAAQGFVLDSQGAFLGLASFSQGLAIRIGD